MSSRRRASPVPFLKATQFAWAVPQVIAHRLARMAVAGPVPSRRDRTEFLRMGTEKAAAFAESWNAMAMEAFRVQQTISALWWRAFLMPWLFANPAGQTATHLRRAQRSILGKGFAPVHRRAVANARRLSRSSMRP